MALDHKRQLPDLAYVTAGSVSTLDLPRDNTFASLGLMWSLVLNTPALMTAASGSEPDAGILAAIRRIEIAADGGLVLWSIDAWSLYILNAMWTGFGMREDLAAPAAGTSSTLQAYLRIPFELPFSKDKNVTLLNAAALTSLQLRVTWGAIGDLFQTVANTTIQTTSVLSPGTHEIVGLDARSIFSAFKVGQITTDISAASTNRRIDLPRGNVLRGLLFKQRVTTNGVEDNVDTVINEITIESSELNRGPYIHRRLRLTDTDNTARPLSGWHARNENRALYGVDDLRPFVTGYAGAAASSSMLTGFCNVEFMEDGRISSSIATQDYSSLAAIMNVAAPSGSPQVVITTQEIIPAAQPA